MAPYSHRVLIVIFFTVNYLNNFATGYLEPSRWTFKVSEQTCHFFQVHRALFNNSLISMRILCNPSEAGQNLDVSVGWVVRQSPCYYEYLEPDTLPPDLLQWYYDCPFKIMGDFAYDTVKYIKKNDVTLTCNHLIDSHFTEIEEKFSSASINSNNDSRHICMQPSHAQICGSSPPPPLFFTSFSLQANAPLVTLNKRSVTSRDSVDSDDRSSESAVLPEDTFKSRIISSMNPVNTPFHQIKVPEDAMYLLILRMASVHNRTSKRAFNAEIEIVMKTPFGYLSAVEYPLLQFYAVMCIIYVVLAGIWMIVSALQWKDLLRIQFWIGGVIFLGMLEKAVFYAEYQSVNVTGQSFKGAVLLAESLSCLKRTLARMLVIIVSLGFGIIKPRLGAMFQRILAVGILYFILSLIEVLLRIYKNPLVSNVNNNQAVMTGVPLALLDSIICWWIFGSLVQTIRTLRLRRNQVKLTLYTQFTNTLVASVVASVLFIIWRVHAHRFSSCWGEWKQLWIDQAFWHLQFSAVLLVIMVLWRPTQNNQRYAFTPMLDGASDDEENELFLTFSLDGSDGVKMRQNSISDSSSHSPNETGKTKEYHLSQQTEEDLKWVQENLSTSFVEAALPSLIDSDEELLTAQVERNKME